MNEQEQQLNSKVATAILCRALGARIVGFGLGVFGHLEMEVERHDGSRHTLIFAGDEGLGVTFGDRAAIPEGEDLALAASIYAVDGEFMMRSDDDDPVKLNSDEMAAVLRGQVVQQ